MAYSLLFRAIEFEIIPACRQADVGVLAYSPLAQGLLTGKFKSLEDVDDERARIRLYSKQRSETVHDEPGCEAEVAEALAEIRAVCDDIGESMTRVALAWVLQQPGISGVLVGARNPEQITENVRCLELDLGTRILDRLDKATGWVKQYIGANADPWRTASRIC
jgi:aryl-alcohol dehydrogenase-like predicted oxidoreductase